MPESILTEIKGMIGLSEDDTAFDLDVRLWINSALSVLNDLGVGPDEGLSIEDKTTTWDSFLAEGPMLDKVKTYVFMKTKYAFDPPGTGFHTTAAAEIIKEHEQRISYAREDEEWVSPEPVEISPEDPFADPVILDGG